MASSAQGQSGYELSSMVLSAAAQTCSFLRPRRPIVNALYAARSRSVASFESPVSFRLSRSARVCLVVSVIEFANEKMKSLMTLTVVLLLLSLTSSNVGVKAEHKPGVLVEDVSSCLSSNSFQIACSFTVVTSIQFGMFKERVQHLAFL
jgi:hypothetical protein